MPVLQPVATAEPAAPAESPADEPPAEEPRRAPSEAPELPRTAFIVALERAKALLDRARVALATATGETAGRPRWLLPVATMGGLALGVGVVALLLSVCGRGKGSEAEPPRLVSACTVTGAARVVAPLAVVGAGVEVRSLGEGIAIGFAPSDHEALALRLDLDSLSTSGSASGSAVDSIRRVLPLLGPGRTPVRRWTSTCAGATACEGVARCRSTRPCKWGPRAATSSGRIRADPPMGKLWPFEGPGISGRAEGGERDVRR